MKSCSATNFMGGSCNNRFGLNKVTFSDPTTENDDHAWLCLEHSNELIDKLMIDIRGLEKQIKICKERISMTKRLPDVGINKDDKVLMSHIKDENGTQIRLKEKIKSLELIKSNALWNLCRHPTCHESLENKTIYSVTIYSAVRKDGSGGRMRKSLYMHKSCWILCKGMCGLKQPIHSGQTMLQSLSN